MRKSWQQKYTARTRPVVKVAGHNYADVQAGMTVLISTPTEIEQELRKIPAGQEVSVHELRRRLAEKHKAETTCPLTTGIFLHIVAENALDQMDYGVPAHQTAPFWRVVTPWSAMARKLTCGLAGVIVLRLREGLPIQPKVATTA